MDKKVLKKILFVLSILFTILTFVGVAYVFLNKGQVSAGYSAVPMLWAVLFTTTYNKVKKDLERCPAGALSVGSLRQFQK